MQALLDVIIPVFLVIGFGYFAARLGKISEGAVEGVMTFAQNFAIPVLLFRAIANMDLSADFDFGLFASFYIGAFSGFALAFAGGRYLFSRSIEDSIAIGFCGMFSNSVLLGLAITERAYGTDALKANFALISVHAPLFYAVGIILMETAKSRGKNAGFSLITHVVRTIFSNALVIGISLGFIVNFTGLWIPASIDAATEMVARAALPAALFGLGGVLVRYKPEGDMKVIAMVTTVSLVAHPTITYALGKWVFELDQAQFRSAVLTAAMAPGVNAYLFANMYGNARRVAASAVLIATGLSVFTVWVWLAILP